MNPMILFDYAYYTIAYLYANNFGYKAEKEYVGVVFLSLIQFFNILTIFELLNASIFDLLKINPLIITLTGCLLFSLLNIVRYKKIITYNELSNKWDTEDNRSIMAKKIGVIFYIILTVVLFIYTGNIN